MKIHILQHLAFETPGMITGWANEKGHKLSYTLLFETNCKFPSPDEFDFLVIMGGSMGVYEEDKYDWLVLEKAFIKQAIAASKVVLGICLGAQLLAEALGAKVYAGGFNEIGFYPVHKTKEGRDDNLIAHIPDSWTVLHWHGDTFNLPAGAVHLFDSKAYKHQGFRVEKCVGLQFHPEADTRLLQDMVHYEKQELIKSDYVQTEEEILNQQELSENRKHLFEFLNKLQVLAIPT